MVSDQDNKTKKGQLGLFKWTNQKVVKWQFHCSWPVLWPSTFVAVTVMELYTKELSGLEDQLPEVQFVEDTEPLWGVPDQRQRCFLQELSKNPQRNPQDPFPSPQSLVCLVLRINFQAVLRCACRAVNDHELKNWTHGGLPPVGRRLRCQSGTQMCFTDVWQP